MICPAHDKEMKNARLPQTFLCEPRIWGFYLESGKFQVIQITPPCHHSGRICVTST
jgi:hypothetical protein